MIRRGAGFIIEYRVISYCLTTGKARFEDEQDALSCPDKRPNQYVYFCIYCRDWHLATQR